MIDFYLLFKGVYMKKSFNLFMLLVLVVILLTSCSTMSKPKDENSSALYGYIEFEEDYIFDNEKFSLFFHPIDEDTDITIEENMSDIKEVGLMMSSVVALREKDNTFWLSNIKDGTYGLIVIYFQKGNVLYKLWFDPEEYPIEIKPGVLNYWGSVMATSSDDKHIMEPHMDISREDVLDILEERLIEKEWGKWLEIERKAND